MIQHDWRDIENVSPQKLDLSVIDIATSFTDRLGAGRSATVCSHRTCPESRGFSDSHGTRAAGAECGSSIGIASAQ